MGEIPESEKDYFVRVTNREIYEAVRDVQARVGNLENQVTTVLKDNSEIKREYGTRLRQLELRTYSILAGCLSIGAMVFKTGLL